MMYPKPTRLRLFRIARGLTQAELVDLARTYQQRLSRIENGSTPPPASDEIDALTAILGVPPDQLFPYKKVGR